MIFTPFQLTIFEESNLDFYGPAAQTLCIIRPIKRQFAPEKQGQNDGSARVTALLQSLDRICSQGQPPLILEGE